MNDYTVYMHENRINHKKYFGITCQKPQYRWGLNGDKYKECPLFWNAIQKYGWDAFNHVIITDGLSAEEASNFEIELIAKHNTADSTYGYNISKGGFGINSETMKERWADPEFKADMSNKMREAWTDSSKREKRSNQAKERWKDAKFKTKVMEAIKHTCGSAVICVETGRVFENICDVENEFGLNHSNICRAIRTGYRCGGYHWKYYRDDVSEKPND